jgi:hypothetical protein
MPAGGKNFQERMSLRGASMEDYSKRTTEEVVNHHLKYFQACDLEEAIRDYTEESTIVNMGGAVHGLDGIRKFLSDNFDALPPETKWVNSITHIDGEIGYTIWTAESPFYSIPFGSDTYIVRNGKIIQQTFAGVMNPKQNK